MEKKRKRIVFVLVIIIAAVFSAGGIALHFATEKSDKDNKKAEKATADTVIDEPDAADEPQADDTGSQTKEPEADINLLYDRFWEGIVTPKDSPDIKDDTTISYYFQRIEQNSGYCYIAYLENETGKLISLFASRFIIKDGYKELGLADFPDGDYFWYPMSFSGDTFTVSGVSLEVNTSRKKEEIFGGDEGRD